MAIERVKKVTLIAPFEDGRSLFDRLFELSLLHITDASSQFQPFGFKRPEVNAEKAGEPIKKLQMILSTIEFFVKKRRGIMEGFFPLPADVTESEMNTLLSTCDVDSLFAESQQIMEEHAATERRLLEIQKEADHLSFFLDLPFSPEEIRGLQRTAVRVGILSPSVWEEFTQDPSVRDLLAWQIISRSPEGIKILMVSLLEEREIAERLLKEYAFSEVPFPSLSGPVSARMTLLRSEREELSRKRERLKERAVELSRYRQELGVLLGYYEGMVEKETTPQHSVFSRRVLIVRGYVRERDMERLNQMLSRDFPGTSILFADPTPADDVPVSIRLSRFLQPMQLLINMYGLPNYFSWDPTSYLTVPFLLFFGVCFGDVIYGLMLIGLAYWMMRRFDRSEETRQFFQLFLYAGISTTIFGALTGSWAGDLYAPEYLGESNFLLRLMQSVVLLDPLAKPIVALLSALAIGVLNQFYGMAFKIYGEVRRGRIMDAFLDGGLWLIALPGFLLLLTPLFTQIPSYLFRSGLFLFSVGAVGLVLTQGRREEGLVVKIITGVVSLYGILGSYGCMSFVGDILSYSRLLALGLTTFLVAKSVNIMAALFTSYDMIGMIPFILILMVGHLFNFFLGIIGSFIHPARLIFLEFFSRFYEGGGVRFKPFGFRSERVQIVQ